MKTLLLLGAFFSVLGSAQLPFSQISLPDDIWPTIENAGTIRELAFLLKAAGVEVVVTDKEIRPPVPESEDARELRLALVDDEKIVRHYTDFFLGWPGSAVYYMHPDAERPSKRPLGDGPIVLLGTKTRRDLLIRVYLQHRIFERIRAAGHPANPENLRAKLLEFANGVMSKTENDFATPEAQIRNAQNLLLVQRRRLEHTRLVFGTCIDALTEMWRHADVVGLTPMEKTNTLLRAVSMVISYSDIVDHMVKSLDILVDTLEIPSLPEKFPEARDVVREIQKFKAEEIPPHANRLRAAIDWMDPETKKLPPKVVKGWAY